ncbi:MAG: 16S rRNA (cytosine(1402)-N(4))-methyltransferase RsmH [Candidatus Doudnabacteria bacterium]|nr:16S rRNA (cytosine(1402)-N(4))-methyltransferase RsmH [Candidatus Doudnabacteria bacterium]
MTHTPVLLKEVLENLKARDGGRFVDATVGSGGHLRGILESNERNEVLGIDLDQTSLDKLREQLVQEGLAQRVKLVKGSYRQIDTILEETGWDKVDGIVADLGFSSVQVDDPGRGFSFAHDGPLDMRYDQESLLTAHEVVNRYHPKEMEQVFADYGEEKFSRRIVSKIVEARKLQHIKSTTQLAEIIRTAISLPVRFKSQDNIRRIFQALRIEVNKELENLKLALPKMMKALKPNGRLCIISFHSLEDRIAKDFFVAAAKDCICPPEFPTCICGKSSELRIITRKPITASETELSENSRSKPAKLRVVEKI